jgi:O-antigen/teichoic acid export membrane protein
LRSYIRSISENRNELAWGLIDQVLNSGVNVLLSLAIGRLLGPASLGTVTITFIVHLVLLALQRALIVEPLVPLLAVTPPSQAKVLLRRGFGLVIAYAVTAALLLYVLSTFGEGPLTTGLGLLAPWTGVLLVHDYSRGMLFAMQEPKIAAVADGSWLVTMLVLLAPILLDGGDEWMFVAAWASGAAVGAVIGLRRLRLLPLASSSTFGWWLKTIWPVSKWFVAEGAVLTLGIQSIFVLIGATIGPAGLGGLRAMQTLFAPLTLIFPAIALPAMPLLTRALHASTQEGRAFAVSLSGLALTATVVYGLVAWTVRSQLIGFTYGPTFTEYLHLILPIGLGQVFLALGVGPQLLLKARRAGRSILLSRTIGVGSTMILSGGGALHNLSLATWGMCCGSLLGSLTSAQLARRDTLPTKPQHDEIDAGA